MYRNFICYRGSSSAGLQVANELFCYLSPQVNDIGETYFSPINNKGENRNFLLDPYKYLGNVENFILLLTKDFFSGFFDEAGNINTNSVTMIELDCVLKNTNVKFIPVIFPDFLWEGQINGRKNRDVIKQIWGEEKMQLIVGAMPVPYVFQYRKQVYELIFTEISNLSFNRKIVIFDFDGTLTKPHSGYNTWETLWIELGYPVEYCEKYHKLYSNNEISHDEWCEITEKYFKEKGLSRKELISASKNAELLSDVKEVVMHLKSKGINLYILSGSIKQYIEIVLGSEIVRCFTEIKANRFVFNDQGKLEGIIGTPYDFEGKARFVKKIIQEKNVKPQDIIYIGNSFNDEFVYTSGVETLCINPRNTDYYNSKVWHNYLRNVTSLKEILPFIEK